MRSSSGRRGKRSTRPVEMPLSTSPLDGFINLIRAAIGPRAYGLKNRERTNRLLMLMQLHANRQDDDSDYVRLIRGVPGDQSRPPERFPPCGHRRRSDRVTSVIIARERISGCTLTLRMHPEMRWGDAGYLCGQRLPCP